jgi:hypothetical protein
VTYSLVAFAPPRLVAYVSLRIIGSEHLLILT